LKTVQRERQGKGSHQNKGGRATEDGCREPTVRSQPGHPVRQRGRLHAGENLTERFVSGSPPVAMWKDGKN